MWLAKRLDDSFASENKLPCPADGHVTVSAPRDCACHTGREPGLQPLKLQDLVDQEQWENDQAND